MSFTQHFVNCEHGFLFHSFAISVAFNNDSGLLMKRDLESIGINCRLVLVSAVGSILEQVDLVMIGAEGVDENGGIVNKIGTSTIAICAKFLKVS